MKKLIGLISLVSTSAFAQILTGPIVNPANGYDYYLTVQSTWTAAESIAVGLGGHLATISNAAENNWVYSTFSDFNGQPCNLWIGLTSGNNDGSILANYFYTSGEPVTYQDFPEGQGTSRPISDSTEHYVYIIAPGINESSTWNNYYDADNASYNGSGQILPVLPIYGVVEVVPEPSAVAVFMAAITLFFAARPQRLRRLCKYSLPN